MRWVSAGEGEGEENQIMELDGPLYGSFGLTALSFSLIPTPRFLQWGM